MTKRPLPTADQTVGPFFRDGLGYPGDAPGATGQPGAVLLDGRCSTAQANRSPTPSSRSGAGSRWSDRVRAPDRAAAATAPSPGSAAARRTPMAGTRSGRWNPRRCDRAGPRSSRCQIFARGLPDKLSTRIYLPDDDAALAADPLLAGLPAGRRATLIARAHRAGPICTTTSACRARTRRCSLPSGRTAHPADVGLLVARARARRGRSPRRRGDAAIAGSRSCSARGGARVRSPPPDGVGGRSSDPAEAGIAARMPRPASRAARLPRARRQSRDPAARALRGRVSSEDARLAAPRRDEPGHPRHRARAVARGCGGRSSMPTSTQPSRRSSRSPRTHRDDRHDRRAP